MNRKYGKLVAAAVLLTAFLLAVSPAGARYDELILREHISYREKEANASGEQGMYLVQEGDSLWQVAGQFDTTVKELKAANGLSPQEDTIKAGQYLRVPEKENIIHRVARGETLSCIAEHYGMKIKEIISLNNIKDADCLPEGEELVLNPARPVFRSGPLPSRSLLAGDLAWPVEGLISSPFGMRDGRPHQGIDIAANQGEIISAAKQGRVIFAGPRGTYGLAVIVDHGNGLKTLYAHCSSILVSAGDYVKTGQSLAKIGSTGRSTGPHLHFEVIWQDVHYDPLLCLSNNYA